LIEGGKQMPSPIWDALKKHYEAQSSDAEANLSMILSGQVTIGEGTDYRRELRRWILQLSEAEQVLETMQKHKNLAN